MEKEKPFCCDICGKRYKNLNGLKYVCHTAFLPPKTGKLTAKNSIRDIPRLATPISSS